LLASAALLAACVLPAAAPVSAAENEVLDLDEAAALLRLPPQTVRGLAESRRIPARRVGNTWRFSRAALLAWLEGGLPAPAAPPAVPAQGAAARPEPAASEKAAGLPPAVGERPVSPTAEEIALRDQRVLLKRGAVTIDFGVAYAHSEQTQLFPPIAVVQRSVGATATLRYGLLDDIQLTLRAPRVWRRTSDSIGDVTHESFNADTAVSLLGVVLHEAAGRPNIILSLDYVAPTGQGDRGVGGGLVLSKSYDPAVIFAGLSYLYGLDTDPTDPQRSLAKRNLAVNMGYTYALNDSLALSTLFIGTYRDALPQSTNSLPPPRERYLLQLGMTWMVARGFFAEPAVAMRLGGPSSDLTLSLNLAYSF
jgi:excisionase family DNA binding protein